MRNPNASVNKQELKKNVIEPVMHSAEGGTPCNWHIAQIIWNSVTEYDNSWG